MKNTAIIYEEVYEILNCLDNNIINKIPLEVMHLFNEKRDKNYKSRIKKDDLFNENNIEKETLNILLYLDLNYIASIEDKKTLYDRYTINLNKQENIKNKNYNTSNLFDKKMSNNNNCCIKDLPDIIKKNNILERFTNILRKFLYKNR